MPQKSKNFVCNIENMQQLVNLCTHAGVRWWLRSEQLFWAKEGDAFQMSPEQEGQLTIPELKSNQQKQIPEWFYTAIMLPNRDISTLETEALKVIASYFLCHAGNIATTILFVTPVMVTRNPSTISPDYLIITHIKWGNAWITCTDMSFP